MIRLRFRPERRWWFPLGFALMGPAIILLAAYMFGIPWWASLVSGLSNLHPTAQLASLIGVLLGAGLAIAEKRASKKVSSWMPSAAGLGIAMVIPFSKALAFFVGGALAEVVRRKNKDLARDAVTSVGAGFLAGESLMGIAIAILVALGILMK